MNTLCLEWQHEAFLLQAKHMYKYIINLLQSNVIHKLLPKCEDMWRYNIYMSTYARCSSVNLTYPVSTVALKYN